MSQSRVREIKREQRKSFYLREISSFIQKIRQDEPLIQPVYVTRVDLSADTGCNTRHILCDRPRRATHIADRGELRRAPGASWHRFSCRHAVGLPDAAGRSKPLHCELPFR